MADRPVFSLKERIVEYREAFEKTLATLRAGKLRVRVAPMAGLYRRPAGAHFHAAPELFIQEGGATIFDCAGRRVRLAAGEVCVMPRGIPHVETRVNTGTSFSVFVCGHFNAGFHIHCTRLSSEDQIQRTPTAFLKSPRGRNAFRYLDEIATAPDSLSDSQRKRFVLGCIEVFLITLLSQIEGSGARGAAPPDSTLVTEAEKLIRWRLAQLSLSVASIAAELGVSADHLSREFRRERSITPKAWIISERLAMARALLLDHKHNIAEVGYACGFNSAPYFVYLFRRRTGITPRAFRASGFRE